MAAGKRDVRLRISGDDEATEVLKRVEGELKKLDVAGKKAAGGMDQVRRSSTSMGGSMRAASTQLGTLVKGFGAAAAAFAAFKLAQMAKGVIDNADALAKLSQKTGATVEELSVLQHGAKLANVETAALQTSLTRLSKALGELDRGTGESVEAFKALGLSAKDFEGKSLVESLVLLSDGFAKFADGPGKAEAAMKIFGRAGADLIPLLNDLANGGFARMNEESTRLGTKMSKEAAAAAEQFKDALTRLGGAASGLLVLLAPILSIIAELASWIAKVIGAVKRLISEIPIVRRISAAVASAIGTARKQQDELAGAPGEDKPQLRLGSARNAAGRLTALNQQLAAQLAAQRAFNELSADLDADRFRQGIIAIEAFHARRRELAEEAAARELAELARDRSAAGRNATAEQRATFEARRQQIETNKERELLKIEQERLETVRRLSSEALAFSREATEARGDVLTHQLADVEAKTEQLRRIHEQLGTPPDVADKVVANFREALTLQVRANDAQRRASILMAEIGTESDRIRADAERGIISESEATRRILQLEQSRKAELAEMARQMLEFAETLGNPELVNAARQLANEIGGMGVQADAADKALANMKETIGGALASDLSNFFGSTITEAENLGEAFIRLAADIVGSIQRIISQIIALKIIQGIGLPVPAFASGGYVSGPGTSTSDSITARLSRGEFVINADAVKHWGVDFLQSINGGLRTPEMRTFGIPRFNTGGVVEAPAGSGSAERMEALLGLEEGLVLRHMESTPGMRATIQAIAANRRAVRHVLGL